MYHKSVMLNESIEGLAIQPNGIYVDATFGGGGHSKEILKRLNTGKLIAFDQDVDVIENKLKNDHFIFINSNFKYLKNFLQLHNAIPVDAILADLGISSHQIDSPKRGFSTRFETDLDMRMDQRQKLTAKTILNSYTENDLKFIFSKYGEFKNAEKIAEKIVRNRQYSKIQSSTALKELIKEFVPLNNEHKFLARIFQALRIEVNNEMENLKSLLEQSLEVLKPGGRLVVISYHSLEDRLVKNFIKTGNFEGKVIKDFYGNLKQVFKAINKKPIIPSNEEIKSNNRARSAKLRIAEKI